MKTRTQYKYWLTLMVITVCSLTAISQTQNSIALTGRTTTSFNLSNITQPGGQSTSIIDDTQWINYSVKSNSSEPFYAISVSVASGSIPPGVSLFIMAGEDAGGGFGRAGRPTGNVQVGYTPVAIINEIGNSNTGSGKNKGHKITLSIIITDFTQLQSADYNLNIIYTLQYQ